MICKYFKFENYSIFHLFRGSYFKGLDRQTWWFFNFAHFTVTDYFKILHIRRYLIQAIINLQSKKIGFFPAALKKSPTRNVMKSWLSKQSCKISNLFQ